MRSYEVDVYDAHELEQWIGELSSGRTDQVIIRDSDAVVAVLRKPDPDTPAGWILAGHFYDDKSGSASGSAPHDWPMNAKAMNDSPPPR